MLFYLYGRIGFEFKIRDGRYFQLWRGGALVHEVSLYRYAHALAAEIAPKLIEAGKLAAIKASSEVEPRFLKKWREKNPGKTVKVVGQGEFGAIGASRG